MRPPCEVVVRRVLPILRALVARELMERHGWTQRRIADALGVTQPAVSTYLSLLERGEVELDLGELRGRAERIAEGLATSSLTVSDAVMEVCSLCINLKSGGPICSLHKRGIPILREEGCDICLRLFTAERERIEERDKVLKEMRRAIERIERCEDFPRVMPEVRVNLVMALPGARSIYDIAGIPGRIVEVRGRAKAFMEPEFGSSRHMAGVLLAAMEIDDSVRAAINIKYDEEIHRVFERLKLTIGCFERGELPPEGGEERPLAALGVKLVAQRLRHLPNVVVDKGGYGIEPVSYLFGVTALDVARRAIQVAEELARGVI
jgi:hypothetical protein